MAKGKRARAEEDIEVNDGREFPFFIIGNALITDYGAKIGAYGVAVYNVLAMYAGQSDKSWPSYQKIADLIGISRQKAFDTVALLVDLGLVTKKNRYNDSGDKTSNLYTLTKQAAWGSTQDRLPPSTPHGLPLVHDIDYRSPHGVHDQDSLNNTQLEQEEREGASAQPSPPPSSPAHEVDVEFMADVPPTHPIPEKASPPTKAPRGACKLQLLNGKIPAGTGDRPDRVYHEIHPLDDDRCKLNDAQRKAIEATVTDLLLWREVVIAWALAGNKPTNIRGQLDWYRDPSRFRKENHHAGTGGHNGANRSGNGTYQPPEAAPFTQEQWREWLANRPPEEIPPY
ncbi:MAG: hypothetical protein IT328_05920 [Caldilineaceae bacterium]|nr:hypothetical protein [Caldilineaceae bacterium]